MPDFLNVNEVLSHLEVSDTMVAAEFGCGSADFTMALAKKLKHGKIYAIDIQEEKLSVLKSKLVHKHINNVSIIISDLEAPSGSTLQNESQDMVLIPNVLFQAENKRGIIEEAKRVLKSGGQCLMMDWLPNAPFGPKENVVSAQEVKKMAASMGLVLKKEFLAGDYHFVLLFTKG